MLPETLCSSIHHYFYAEDLATNVCSTASGFLNVTVLAVGDTKDLKEL